MNPLNTSLGQLITCKQVVTNEKAERQAGDGDAVYSTATRTQSNTSSA